MKAADHSFAERWRLTVRNVQDGADRMQATADAFPRGIAAMISLDVDALYLRHAEALADHTVALNCLGRLIAERLGDDMET